MAGFPCSLQAAKQNTGLAISVFSAHTRGDISLGRFLQVEA